MESAYLSELEGGVGQAGNYSGLKQAGLRHS